METNLYLNYFFLQNPNFQVPSICGLPSIRTDLCDLEVKIWPLQVINRNLSCWWMFPFKKRHKFHILIFDFLHHLGCTCFLVKCPIYFKVIWRAKYSRYWYFRLNKPTLKLIYLSGSKFSGPYVFSFTLQKI